MVTCEVCGNQYDKAMEIKIGNHPHFFDCFECAIHALAPVCGNCGCRIVGHGVECDEEIYCGAHCASQGGVEGATDRV